MHCQWQRGCDRIREQYHSPYNHELPQVDIDLGAEHGADTVRVNTSMALIGTDGNRFHFRDDNAAHYSIHLYRVISRIPSNYSFYNSALLFTPIQNGVSNVAPEIHLFLPWLS